MKPEEQVQKRLQTIYEGAGGFVYDLSQGYREDQSTRQTEGLGDLFVVFVSSGLNIWHETKSIRPADLAKKDWLATRFARTVIPNVGGPIDKITARGICDRPELLDVVLAELAPERRREIYKRKQSKDQEIFQDRIEAAAGFWKTPPVRYVLGGVLEALEALRLFHVKPGG